MLHEIIYYLAIALIAAVCIIITGKIILARLIQKDADYYEAYELMEENEMLTLAGLSPKEQASDIADIADI